MPHCAFYYELEKNLLTISSQPTYLNLNLNSSFLYQALHEIRCLLYMNGDIERRLKHHQKSDDGDRELCLTWLRTLRRRSVQDPDPDELCHPLVEVTPIESVMSYTLSALLKLSFYDISSWAFGRQRSTVFMVLLKI
jgi:hypothetical protein